jgi:hypothetical protein
LLAASHGACSFLSVVNRLRGVFVRFVSLYVGKCMYGCLLIFVYTHFGSMRVGSEPFLYLPGIGDYHRGRHPRPTQCKPKKYIYIYIHLSLHIYIYIYIHFGSMHVGSDPTFIHLGLVVRELSACEGSPRSVPARGSTASHADSVLDRLLLKFLPVQARTAWERLCPASPTMALWSDMLMPI